MASTLVEVALDSAQVGAWERFMTLVRAAEQECRLRSDNKMYQAAVSDMVAAIRGTNHGR